MSTLPIYIDSSMLSTYRACPKRFYYTYIRNKVPVGESIHLTAGRAFAAACDSVRKTQFHSSHYDVALTRDEIAEVGMAAFAKEWGDLEVSPDHPKNFHNVFAAFEQYMEEYHPFHDEVKPYWNADKTPTTEFTFAIPLSVKHPSGDPFLFCGRFDLLGSYNGLPVILDEKTGGRVSGATKWSLRGQFLGYCWACQQHDYEVRDVIVREVVLQKTQNQIIQVPLRYPQFLIEKWANQTHHTIAQIIASFEHNHWDYNFADSCSSYNGCAYADVCSTQVEEQILDTWVDRTWTPLNNPEAI